MMNSRRITLDHIPAVNNAEILEDVLGSSEAIFKAGKAYRKRMIQQKRQGGSYNRSDSFQTLHSPRSSTGGPLNLTTARSLQTSRSQANFMSGTTSPYGLQIPQTAHTEESVNRDQASQYIWDYEAENDFKSHKEDARARLFHHIKSSSWNEVGLAPFIQISHKEESQKSQRNHLLERYRKGDFLSTQEFSKIASTSQLLNSNSDKQLIQSVVNQLDPEIVDAVETDLAQKILHDYQYNRSQIQKARMEYLNFDNLMTKKKVHDNNEKHERNLRIQYGQEEQARLVKDMSQRYENYEKRKKAKEKTSRDTSMTTTEESKKLKSPDSERTASKAKKKATKNIVIDVNASKRYNHPSSKILIINEERQKDFLGLIPSVADPKLSKRVNEDPNQFSLQIHSSPTLKGKQLFSRYYSGGPPEYEYEGTTAYYATDIPKFKGTQLEHKAATLLKAHIKGLLEREKFVVTKRHILEDRKTVRKLRNDDEGLPDVLKAVFLAITEDKSDAIWKNNNNRKSISESNRLKAMVLELQQKDPFLFGQFKREVMKQYYIYQISHHGRHRGTKNNQSDPEAERKALIATLKNAMSVISNQSQFAGAVLENESELSNKKRSEGSVLTSQRKTLVSATPQTGPLMTTTDENEEKEMPARSPKPRNTMSKSVSSFTDIMKKQGNEIPPNRHARLFSNGSLKEVTQGVKAHFETPKANATGTLASIHEVREKVKKAVKKMKPEKRSPRPVTSALRYKQSKLMTAAKSNNFNLVQASGFSYTESDVNIKDERKNTPLYYAAKAGNFTFCQYLTDLNAMVNEHCEQGNTPLHMAFKSDNEGVIMLLLVKGGNLNTLNDEGFTPLAFGSERILSLLDLKSGIATYNKQGRNSILELPKEHDNNYLLNRGNWAKEQEDPSASIKYKAFETPKHPVRSDSLVSSYMQPGDSQQRLSKPIEYNFSNRPTTAQKLLRNNSQASSDLA